MKYNLSYLYFFVLCFNIILPCKCLSFNKFYTSTNTHFIDTNTISAGAIKAAKLINYYNREIIKGKTIDTILIHKAATLSDAIRLFSGVQIKDYGGLGGLKTINIRSLGSEHSSVYIDGFSVDNAQNMQVDLGRFSPLFFDNIQVYNGQRSLHLQSAKEYINSNALYLLSKAPYFNNKTYNLWAYSNVGSFNTANWGCKIEYKFSNNLCIKTNIDYTKTGGNYPFTLSRTLIDENKKLISIDTTLYRHNSDVHSLRSMAKLFWINGDGTIYYYKSSRGVPGAVIRRTLQNSTSKDRQNDESFFMQCKHSFNDFNFMGVPCFATIKGKFSYDYLHYYTQPTIDYGAMPIDNNYLQISAYASYSQLFVLSKQISLNFSQDLQYNYLDSNLYNFVYPNRFNSWTAVAASYYNKGFKVMGSVAYQYIKDWVKKVDGAFRVKGGSNNIISHCVMLSYDIIPANVLSVNAFAKHSGRMPNFNDLYYTHIGNAALKPEFTMQYNLGLNSAVVVKPYWGLTTRVDVYYNNVKNKIIAVPTSSQFRWTMFNIGKVKIYGADVDAKIEYNNKQVKTYLKANYTYQKALDYTQANSYEYKNQIPYVPVHCGSALCYIDYKGWSVLYSLFVSGRKWSTGVNIEDYLVEPWNSSDVQFAKITNIKGVTIEAKLDIKNIFNAQYYLVKNFPIPGRYFMLGVAVQL